ncbi:hypothetical protein LPJ72_003989 [Coemansia sp. Benny D160-2]|nr:hypothetical protein LPJ72_003989 [Coemansia sp. Benny D160-2]
MDATSANGANTSNNDDNHIGPDESNCGQMTETTPAQQVPERTEESVDISFRQSDSANRDENNEIRLRRRREGDQTEAAVETEGQTTARQEDKGKRAVNETRADDGGGSADSRSDKANEDSAAKEEEGEEASQLHPDNASNEFSCNICFDTSTDPVLTICGHLFCWSCLAQWLERSATCPVCKAGCDKEKVIPVYGRGKDEKDPRLNPNIPSRPVGQRPPAPQRQHSQFFGFDSFGVPGSFHGIGGGIAMGRMGGATHTYIGGFGILPALMGFSSFPINAAGSSNSNSGNAGGSGTAGPGQQAGQQAFVSRVLMMLAAMILMSIVFS